MSGAASPWFEVANVAEIPSPSVLVYPERAERNLQRLLEIAGGPDRLRPHMKTHKMPAITRLHLRLGIKRFKCATIAEAEMLAQEGAPDVLLAYQPVGPNVPRVIELAKKFPGTKFSVMADDPAAVRTLSAAVAAAGLTLEMLLDLNTGMNRCGIQPGPAAVELYRQIATSPGLIAGGLHAYDGHITESDLARRTQLCEEGFAQVTGLKGQLEAASLNVPRVVAGGTPTFPIHARRAGVEASPGTCVFWDFSYADKLPEMPFEYAALLLTRVVSKPAPNRLCLDLGHKAVASENPHPRVRFLNLPEAGAVMHSEEHLVLETPHAGRFDVGDVLYGVPRHVCPSIALHSEAWVVRCGRVCEKWAVTARERRLTI